MHPECPGWDHECQECSRAECECDAIPNRVPITREDEQRALDKGMAEERAKGWRFKPERSAEEESRLADNLHHATRNRVQMLRQRIADLDHTSMNVGGPGSRSIRLLDEVLEILDADIKANGV